MFFYLNIISSVLIILSIGILLKNHIFLRSV